jgi:hypothetical protein
MIMIRMMIKCALKIIESDSIVCDEIKVGLVLSQECPFLVKIKETFGEESDLESYLDV